MVTEHWPRGTQVTRLYERDSLALSLIRSSGETRAHRSPSARTTLAPPSERPNGRWISAFLTVRRLLYSNGFLPPFSSAEFCSAYLTSKAPFKTSLRMFPVSEVYAFFATNNTSLELDLLNAYLISQLSKTSTSL